MVTVTIDIPDDIAAVLTAKVAAQGLTLEGWVRLCADREVCPSRKGRYTLAQLIEQCDEHAALSAEDRAWL